LPAGLAVLIKRLLAKNPADRPASAGHVAQELAGLESADPDTEVPLITAVPDAGPADPWSDIDAPAPPREPAPARRPRWRAAASLVVAAVLVVVGAVALYLTRAPRGTVVLEPADAEAEGRLRLARVQLSDDGGRLFALEPGERSRDVPPGAYRVLVAGERLDPVPARVEVHRGETAVVRVVGTPPMVRPIPPKKSPAADADADAAEWVHGLGGTLGLVLPGGKSVQVGPDDGLPPGPYTVRLVRVERAPAAGGLFRLAPLQGLEVLHLADCQLGDPDLGDVGAVTTLKELTVRAVDDRGLVTDAGVAHLARLTRLERLTLAGQPVTDGGLAHLTELAALKTADFRGTKVSGTGLAEMNNSAWLQTVHLGSAKDAGVAALAHFPHLTHVDLGDGRNVTDKGLQHLGGLAHLETLIAHNSRLSDDGLKSLTGLKRLRGLGADGTKLTDAGLVHLRAFPQIVSLGVGATAVTDEGLKALPEVKTLQWLNLRRTKVTADGVKALHAALPGCRIESDHGELQPK
jgi:hypothetical protein